MSRKVYGRGEDFDTSEGLLTPEEMAELYGVDRSTAVSWGRNGWVPWITTPGNQYRFSRAWHRADVKALGR